MAFDTDDPMFVRGFEIGRMWASLPADRRFIVHTSNAEMVMRVGEHFGMRGRSVELGDGAAAFMEVTFQSPTRRAGE